MPTQKTITVYTIEELTPKAKEKALSKMREVFDTDYSPVIEDAEMHLESLGYRSPQISFSGFYSQGDGASFVTDDGVDILAWFVTQPSQIKTQFPLIVKHLTDRDITASIYRIDHRRSHERTISAKVSQGDILIDKAEQNALDLELAAFEKLLDADAETESESVYRMLCDYYEADQADDFMIENANANEYTFDEFGNLA